MSGARCQGSHCAWYPASRSYPLCSAPLRLCVKCFCSSWQETIGEWKLPPLRGHTSNWQNAVDFCGHPARFGESIPVQQMGSAQARRLCPGGQDASLDFKEPQTHWTGPSDADPSFNFFDFFDSFNYCSTPPPTLRPPPLRKPARTRATRLPRW